MTTTSPDPASLIAAARRAALLARVEVLRADLAETRATITGIDREHRAALTTATLAGKALPARPATAARAEDRAAGLEGAIAALEAEAAGMAAAIQAEVRAAAIGEYAQAVERFTEVRDRSLALAAAAVLALPGAEVLPAATLVSLAEDALALAGDPLRTGGAAWGLGAVSLDPGATLADLRAHLAADLARAGVVDGESWSRPGEALLVAACPVPPVLADDIRCRALLVLGGCP